MSYDELELDKLGDRRTAAFFIISDTDTTYNFIRPLAKLAQAVKVADASNQRKAKCKTVSAIAVALREDTKSFDKADNVFNKDTIF